MNMCIYYAYNNLLIYTLIFNQKTPNGLLVNISVERWRVYSEDSLEIPFFFSLGQMELWGPQAVWAGLHRHAGTQEVGKIGTGKKGHRGLCSGEELSKQFWKRWKVGNRELQESGGAGRGWPWVWRIPRKAAIENGYQKDTHTPPTAPPRAFPWEPE